MLRVAIVIATLCTAASADRGPTLASPSVIAIDATTGDVLFARGADDVRPIASMTKLFAALVLRARRLDLSKSTTINYDDAVASIGGASTFLLEGQRFANADLLYAMMLSSDNRTPTALARSTGMSRDDLLLAMRKRAADLGLTRTTFVDVTGIGADRAVNSSTAREMALALREAIRDPILRRVMTTKSRYVASESGEVSGNYRSTLPALWTKRTILGGKTGWTEEAGYCQIVAVQIDGRPPGDRASSRAKLFRARPGRVIVMAFLGAREKAARLDDFEGLASWLARSGMRR